MSIVFMINFLLVKGDVFIDSEALLVTDFVNLKIKLTQSLMFFLKKDKSESATTCKQASYMLHVYDPNFHFHYAFAQHIQPILPNSS
jgi:ABC-type uncharacterized transport system substrate-binding protein